MRLCVKPPLVIRGTEFGGPKPLFCIPLVAPDLQELLRQARIARDLQSDVIEWRADSYAELTVTGLLDAAHALRSALGREPVLFTLRVATEGGVRQISQDLRAECIDALLHSGFIDLVDVEFANGPQFVEPVIKAARDRDKKVVLSFHDFQATPSHELLLEKISAMVRQGADIAKIACMPREPGDVLRLLEVTLAARQSFPSVPLCTTSMSGLGLVSRLAGFLYGSDMAFAAGAASSAPGQIAIGEARALTATLLRNV